MKRTMIFAILATLAAPIPAANALISPYLGGSFAQGNAYFNNGGGDTSYSAFGVQAGVKVPFVRVEVEYNRMFDEMAIGLGMLNAYLEPFPFLPFLSPYAGLGIGRVFDAKVGDVKLAKNSAGQIMLGTGLSFPEFPIRFDAEARGIFTGNLQPKDNPAFDRSVHMMTFELRLKASYMF